MLARPTLALEGLAGALGAAWARTLVNVRDAWRQAAMRGASRPPQAFNWPAERKAGGAGAAGEGLGRNWKWLAAKRDAAAPRSPPQRCGPHQLPGKGLADDLPAAAGAARVAEAAIDMSDAIVFVSCVLRRVVTRWRGLGRQVRRTGRDGYGNSGHRGRAHRQVGPGPLRFLPLCRACTPTGTCRRACWPPATRNVL